MFRVRAVSLGGNGPFTDPHEFSVIKPVRTFPRGWILLTALLCFLLVCTTSITFIYRHKIVLFRRESDMVRLMEDIALTDFTAINLRRDSDESVERNLHDIIELEE